MSVQRCPDCGTVAVWYDSYWTCYVTTCKSYCQLVIPVASTPPEEP
jgi:hypothetical protein